MATWQSYIDGMIVNEPMPDGSWLTNICQEAAIIQHDGSFLAQTPGFSLGTYEVTVMDKDEKPQTVTVNEKEILINLAFTGKATTKEAGIRINNTKFMLAKYDSDSKTAYLSKAQGGACVMATATTIIFASYNTSLKMSNGLGQNAGKCNLVVEKLAKMLLANKF